MRAQERECVVGTAPESKKRIVAGLNNRKQEFTDKYLRDSVVVTVNTRNIGGDLFK